MPLQKQKIPLALSSGMDTKSDEFNATSFKLVENLKYNKPGALTKIPGYTAYNTTLLNVGSNIPTISSGNAIYSFNGELLINTPKQFLTYSSYYNSWVSKNYYNVNSTNSTYTKKNTGITFVKTSVETKFQNLERASTPSFFANDNYIVSISPDADTAGIKIRVDLVSEGTTIINSFIPDLSSGTYPKLSNRRSNILGILNNVLYIACYLDVSTDLLIYTYNLNTPNTLPTTVSKNFDYYTNGYLDSDGHIYLCGSNGTAQYFLKYKISDGTTTTNTLTSSTAFSSTYIDDLGANTFRVSSPNSGNFYTAVINKADLTLNGSFTLVTSANESGVTANDGTNTYFIYTKSATTASGTFITALAANNSTNVLGGEYRIFGRNIGMVDKALYNSGNIYMPVYSFNSSFYSKYLLKIDLSQVTTAYNSEIIGRSGYLSSYFTNYFNSLYYISGNIYLGQIVMSEDFSGSSPLDSNTKFNYEIVKHELVSNSSKASIVNSQLIIPSSITRYYDGETISEYGFLDFPGRQGSITQNTAGIVPYFATGTYGFALVYSWIDNNGYRHNSAPMFFSETVSAGNIRSISFNVYNLALTNKENIYIDVYRTLVDGTVYYKAENNVLNNPLDFTTTITLIAPDNAASDVDRFEILYTNSGELENDSPEAGNVSAVFKNRVFIANSDYIQYSKLIEQGKPVSFNANLLIKPDTKGNDITSIIGMDNVLVIFKRDSIMIQPGDGPNNLGQSGDYGIPQEISSDVGCVDAKSVVLTPEGVMFKSEKGIYILNRGLYVSYIGAQVESYNNEEIISSVLLNNSNEVRFATNTKILSYDYYSKQWSVFTNVNSSVVDTTIHDNSYHYIKNNGVVYQEDADIFTNNGSYYSGKFETNWITVGSINVNGSAQTTAQGFQRLYTINVLGKYKSAHDLKVSLAYNYNDTIIDYATIEPSGTGVYQFEVKPSIQKCEAFKIIVEDINQSGTGESMVISHILLEVGIRGSAQKVVADSNRFPAT